MKDNGMVLNKSGLWVAEIWAEDVQLVAGYLDLKTKTPPFTRATLIDVPVHWEEVYERIKKQETG